jgi:hypothetical protein
MITGSISWSSHGPVLIGARSIVLDYILYGLHRSSATNRAPSSHLINSNVARLPQGASKKTPNTTRDARGTQDRRDGSGLDDILPIGGYASAYKI